MKSMEMPRSGQHPVGFAHRTHLVPVAVVVAGLLWPILFSGFPTSFMAQVWFYAVFALSADVLMGYTGLFSLGHAAFFGIGAYTAALVGLNVGSSVLLMLPLAMVIAALAGLAIGILVIRQSGVYFIMLSFAFAQLVVAVAIVWRSVTGGTDGLSGVPAPTLGLGGFTVATFSSEESSYMLCFVVFIFSYLILRQIVASPFGLALKGIRENPDRMLALGYSVQHYKLAAVVLSAAFAGLAGALSVANTRFVSTGDLDWSLSGLVMAMIMMGGMGRLAGAPIGALVILFIQFALGNFTLHWQFVLGLIFVVLVLVSVNGIIGVWDLGTSSLKRKWPVLQKL
jgi:branched-chain amino acid transport system permease protein